MQIKVISNSPFFTKDLGRTFSKVVSEGDIILFSGELGGGKTTFITGIAGGFGLMGKISSPSFTIINEYLIDSWRKLVHVDLYRLENIGEVEGIGLDDYLYDGTSIICVEWGDRIKGYIKREFMEVDFSYVMNGKDEENKRKIIFKSSGKLWDGKLKEFEKIFGK
ncbi:MAG: tRNA (adenosine(37)-N6)-threonylcarbamoyltransferase complex ATPase subunit type 1 TsaE [Actinomycetota bacterium]|nr:tRNA (adenosine(37)-N6)-threonylcarbamoyltransferase complex ATPase subunit type 1 TsaE [Actinomycetota bacterium]